MPRRTTESSPRPPTLSAAPTSSEMSSTCRISPLANASTIVLGMMLIANPSAVKWLAAPDRLLIAGSMAMLLACRPAPG